MPREITEKGEYRRWVSEEELEAAKNRPSPDSYKRLTWGYAHEVGVVYETIGILRKRCPDYPGDPQNLVLAEELQAHVDDIIENKFDLTKLVKTVQDHQLINHLKETS